MNKKKGDKYRRLQNPTLEFAYTVALRITLGGEVMCNIPYYTPGDVSRARWHGMILRIITDES